ncbi:maintenance of mitochondrial structure and function-domain-containing protein [Pavlovales sp. CCMP2436]|nr:maintenance of mitochondrial structure and function-domain-containing protein [Pavlovales sp. CCMP2436]
MAAVALAEADITPALTARAEPLNVVVHPIVLLNAVDHYNRVARDTKRRVVGILLGEISRGVYDVTSSFAVPFEEDEKDPSIWFLDHNFLEQMHAMFKKVSAREKIIGWYSTGPRIRPGDIDIDKLVRRYTPTPAYVIIDVKPVSMKIPTTAYYAVEESKGDVGPPSWTFKHITSEIGALESEEVGVEHLLRDVKDTTISTLSNEVTAKLSAIRGLQERLGEIGGYLKQVIEGKLPINHQIMYMLQDVFNLLPNAAVEELVKAMSVKTNDMSLAIYLASIIRSVVALHNLIDNKLVNKERERSDEKKDKDKEAKDKVADKAKLAKEAGLAKDAAKPNADK